MAKRPAEAIIDDAIADNRWWEWVCFGLVILFVASGLTTLAVGIINGRDLVALAGGGVTVLFVPAMHFAKNLRERNMRIRMSEAAVALAKTSEEVRAVLRETFGAPAEKKS